MHLKISLDKLEVLSWVNGNIHALVELIELPRGSLNSFAGWKSLLELLNGGNHGDNSTEDILKVFLFVSRLEGLNGGVNHQESLVLYFDALKEGGNIEGSTEGLNDSSQNGGSLEFFVLLLEFWGSDEGFGSSLTNVLSETEPVLLLIVSN